MTSCGFLLHFSGGKVSCSLCFPPFPSSVEIGSFRGVCHGFNVSVVLAVSFQSCSVLLDTGKAFPTLCSWQVKGQG